MTAQPQRAINAMELLRSRCERQEKLLIRSVRALELRDCEFKDKLIQQLDCDIHRELLEPHVHARGPRKGRTRL